MSNDEHHYSKKQALRIHDESLRFQREVSMSVLTSGAIVIGVALFYGLFMLTQVLQRGTPASVGSPDVVMLPASGSLLSTAFGALLAVILAVWFSPNAFRLGKTESPTTIARELATQTTISAIARLCTLLSLAVALWAFLSSVVSTGPQQLDLLRTIGPAILGFGLAWWSAAAEVRVSGNPIRRLQWARQHREARRVRMIVDAEDARRLSPRGLLLQRGLAFGLIPVAACVVGLWIYPAPNVGTVTARLVTTVAVTLIGYKVLCNFLYNLVGRQVGSASLIVAGVAFTGILLTSAAAGAALPGSGSTAEALELAPVGRSVLLISVITLFTPFMFLAVLSFPRLFGRAPGLLYDSVMRRYDREAKNAKKAAKELQRADAGGIAQDSLRKPIAWASWAALLPVPPFNFLFAVRALRQAREGRERGAKTAIVAIVSGVLLALVGTGLVIYTVLGQPRLVYCEPQSTAVCLDLG